MSQNFIKIAAGLAIICGALIATEALSAHGQALILSASCKATELARAGELTYLARQDAWISRRGDVFRLSLCPLLKDALITRNA
jgi:hypothetical protein